MVPFCKPGLLRTNCRANFALLRPTKCYHFVDELNYDSTLFPAIVVVRDVADAAVVDVTIVALAVVVVLDFFLFLFIFLM